MRRRWSTAQSVRVAVESAGHWLIRVLLRAQLLSRALDAATATPVFAIDGLDLHLLDTAEDLALEGVRMNNCISSYAGRVARGANCLISVRIDGARRANAEIDLDATTPDVAIAQLEGPNNEPLAPEDRVRIQAALEAAWRSDWLTEAGARRRCIAPAVWARFFAEYLKSGGAANTCVTSPPTDGGASLVAAIEGDAIEWVLPANDA